MFFILVINVFHVYTLKQGRNAYNLQVKVEWSMTLSTFRH